MSKHRYVGGIISATAPTPSQASASGVWTLDEAQYYQKSGQWPPGGGNDPYFQYNTLLLHGDGTNGAQNNTFLDGSANNFTITRNGNTTQGSATPYVGPGNWSNYYAATQSGWQTPANSASTIIGSAFNSTVTFTAEAWIYPLSRHSGGGAVLGYVVGQMQIAGSAVDWSFGPDSNGNLVLFWYTTSNQISKGSSVIPLNTWTHIALSVSNGTIRMFVNGVQETLTGLTTTAASSTTTSYISSGGYLYAGTTWQGFNGYISNLRVIGKRAVYTTGFTPSTTPLIATTDTTLLVNNQSGLTDMSGAGWPLTVTGGIQVSKFSPFTFYQTSPANYSGYFDGTGDYLSMAASPSTALGSGDFTVEYWAFYDTFASSPIGFDSRSSSGDITPSDYVTTGGNLVFYYNSANLLTSTNAAVLGRWNHIAWVRAGNVLTSYINGVASGSVVSSANFGNSQPFRIAGNITAANFLNGSISNFRVVKGTAVYTANFTPSVAALTSTTTVSSSASNSVSFDGTGDYLSVASNAAFGFGTGDFTVEYWIYATSWTSTPTIVDLRAAAGVSGFSDYYSTSGAPNMYWHNATILTSSLTVPVNTWTHVAYTRQSGAVKIFVNGALGASGTSTSDLQASVPCRIGATFTPNNLLTGFVSNLRITKGQALYTAAFTPPTTPLTTTSQGATAANVSLLTCQDRLLEDNSNNLFAVTPTGDARPTSANPFVSTNGIGGTSYSGYFGGASYLSVPASSAFAIPTSTTPFTIEAWIYPNSFAGGAIFTDTYTASDTIPISFHLSNGSVVDSTNGQVLTLAYYNGSVWTNCAMANTNVVANQWQHVAAVFTGSTCKLFLNGVDVTKTTSPTPATTWGVLNDNGSTWLIGRRWDTSANVYFNGSISNFRFVKGTAVYTANFSPPTAPLTAITNTQLLTCQNTTFIDNSTNAFTITNTNTTLTDEFNPFSGATTLLTCQSTTFIDNSAIPVTITANGNATPKRANPFTDTVTGPTPYATTTYGGSAYFDGTGDYLTLGSQTNFAFGTGDFTIEAWIYPFAVAAGAQTIYDTMTQGDATGTGRIGFDFSTVLRFFTGAGTILISGGTMVARAWQHVALCKASGSTRLFLNGTQVGSTYADSNNYVIGTANRPIIGVNAYDASSNIFTGYISNLRVIKGTGLYTAPFVPPAAPVTAVTNTQLLVNGTNAGIFDNTTINDIETVGSAQVSTSVVKYGTGSMSFNGLNSYLFGPNTPNLDLGSGNFTIEGWFYTISVATNGLISKWNDGGNQRGWKLDTQSAGTMTFYYSTTGSDFPVVTFSGASLDANTWTHLALVRNGSTLTLYKNGTAIGSSAFTATIFANTSQSCIGGWFVSTGTPQTVSVSPFNGYMDDIRITKGVARYTANFTPPIQAFPNY